MREYRTAYLTVESGVNQVFPMPPTGIRSGRLHFGNVTGLTCTVQASYDGLLTTNSAKVYTNIATVTAAGVIYAAGATVTTADDMDLLFICQGADAVKVTYVGGTSGPVRFIGTDDASELVAALLKAVATGISVTITEPLGVDGVTAHDAADTGEPIKVGGRARTSEIAAVANNDRTDFVADAVGKQIVQPYANPENFVSGTITTAMTGTTSTLLVAAPAAGLRNYITQITASNAHASVGTDINITDGDGGTVLYVVPTAANYGGAVISFPTPLRQPTTATAIYAVNVTTGSSTKISASGWKGA